MQTAPLARAAGAVYLGLGAASLVPALSTTRALPRAKLDKVLTRRSRWVAGAVFGAMGAVALLGALFARPRTKAETRWGFKW